MNSIPKRFVDISVNPTERYSLGRDEQSGDYYLSTPVANQMTDYEEFFAYLSTNIRHLQRIKGKLPHLRTLAESDCMTIG